MTSLGIVLCDEVISGGTSRMAIQSRDYVPTTMVRLPGARTTSHAQTQSYSRPATQSHIITMTSRSGGAVGGAVGGAMQVGGNDIQSVLKGLLEVLVKVVQMLVERLAQQVGGANGGVKGDPTQSSKGSVGAAGGGPSIDTTQQSSIPSTPAIQANGGNGVREDSATEQRVVDLVNQERAKYGLSPLRYNTALDRAAEKHNATQANERTMAHIGTGDSDPGSRIRAEGFTRDWGENVAVGQRSAEQVVAEWMASPTHRANILNPNFTQLGVSYTSTHDGYPFWTQSFGA